MSALTFQLGVKRDPILYRYSYSWLFRLMAEEGVRHVQLGSFFELYQLPDSFFHRLRGQATDHGITISSVFTAHREIGGYFQGDEWVGVARKNHERLIEIAALLGARAAGTNPGAVLRDRMGTKSTGLATYLRHMQELMHRAHALGVPELTIEPMSCAAEPPALPDEQKRMAEELFAYHAAHPDTAAVGYCIDIAHGYCDAQKQVVCNHWGLLEAGLPWCRELHLKNTDATYDKTFGFREDERKRGVIDVAATRAWLQQRASVLPVRDLVGYLEIGGPKLGRDYSDGDLEGMLRESLRHLKATWLQEQPAAAAPAAPIRISPPAAPAVRIAPSIMCADQLHLEQGVRLLEQAGADMLHLDVMDARFTPNLPLGLDTIRALRNCTALPLDLHLMVEDPDWFVRQAKELGAQQVSVHVESCRHLDRTLATIRDLGMKAGAALNPHTPLDMLEYVAGRLDFVLLMTVNPGFAGQKLVPSGLGKIADCRAFLDRHGSRAEIAVDGNVSFAHIPDMVAAGADVLVAGTSSVYAVGASISANTARTREAIAAGLARRPVRKMGAAA